MRQFVAVLVVAVAVSNTAYAEGPEPETSDPDLDTPSQLQVPDVGGPGEVADLAPGDRAPDFRVSSSTGRHVGRSDLLGQMSILLFARDCSRLAAYSGACDSLLAAGVHAYGVCQESKKHVVAAAADLKITFPVLSDPNADLARGFGMYDEDAQEVRSGFVLLNEKTVVRIVFQSPGVTPEAMRRTVGRAIQNP
jgi:peroxiredoxin